MNNCIVIDDSRRLYQWLLTASVEELERLGPGELARLSTILNADIETFLRVQHDYYDMRELSEHDAVSLRNFLETEGQIDDRFQKAFFRAYTSNQNDFGAYALEYLLVKYHLETSDVRELLTDEAAKNIVDFLSETQGVDLNNLSRDELSFIYYEIFNDSINLIETANVGHAQDLIISAYYRASDQIKMRTVITLHESVEFDPEDILYRTTLFAKIHKKVSSLLAQDFQDYDSESQDTIQDSLSKIMLRAVHNHVDPQEVLGGLTQLLNDLPISIDRKNLMLNCINNEINRFHPSNNLGLQMETPLAKRMENAFAVEVINSPTLEMQKVLQKIFKQLELSTELDEYTKGGFPYVFAIVDASMQPEQMRSELEQGTNPALLMDFLLYVSESLEKNTKNEGSSLKMQELWRVREAVYEAVKSERGPKVSLPINYIAHIKPRVGVGTSLDALPWDKQTHTRPSALCASFGPLACQSAEADVAQGCGITGRGNQTIYALFALLESLENSSLDFSKEEIRQFLLILAAVMTADGGHTLSEVLATTFLAARNLETMSFIGARTLESMSNSSKRVSDIFTHMKEITDFMEENQFRYFDNVFDPFGPEIKKLLQSVWDWTVQSS